MPVIVGGDKEGKQLRFTIPKSLCETFGIKKGTKLKLQAISKDKILLMILRNEE